MKEKKLKKYNVAELRKSKLKEINGGFWGLFWAGYVISEVINGVQDGLSTDCSEVEC